MTTSGGTLSAKRAKKKQIFDNNPHISCLDQWFVDYVFALAIDVEEGYYDTEGVANNVNDNDQGAIDNEQDQPSSNDDQQQWAFRWCPEPIKIRITLVYEKKRKS